MTNTSHTMAHDPSIWEKKLFLESQIPVLRNSIQKTRDQLRRKLLEQELAERVQQLEKVDEHLKGHSRTDSTVIHNRTTALRYQAKIRYLEAKIEMLEEENKKLRDSRVRSE